VLQFAPQDFVNIPGTVHDPVPPSLLPKYRGPSSINWPIHPRRRETGLSIFGRPMVWMKPGDPAEGDPDRRRRHVGTVYFARLFPMGVKAMLKQQI